MARIGLLVAAFLIGSAAIASAEPKTSQEEFNGGKWHQVTHAAPSTPVADPVLDHVEQLMDAHDLKGVHDLLIPWLKDNPNVSDRDRALYLLADYYFQNDDRLWSFYQCDELMDKYPESRYFSLGLELQYAVADGFLNGYKRKFLGFHILSAEDEAIEMLYRIQARSPGSAIAERCLLRTADYYYRTSQFDLAGDAYASFSRSYPRSTQIPWVKLRQAFSSLAQFRGARYDATPLLDARTQFKDIIDKFPKLAADENLPERIERIDNTLANKLYYMADFYHRTSHDEAAVYTYRTLIATYPNSPSAVTARKALDQLPAAVLLSTPPGEVEDVGAAEAPSGALGPPVPNLNGGKPKGSSPAQPSR